MTDREMGKWGKGKGEGLYGIKNGNGNRNRSGSGWEKEKEREDRAWGVTRKRAEIGGQKERGAAAAMEANVAL